ncbi:MAG: DUF4157 domain-containing protein [Nitrospirae bacterium]|nr:MAG: DUF4157 domain-containing protein [Nitrospirota bacterium]
MNTVFARQSDVNPRHIPSSATKLETHTAKLISKGAADGLPLFLQPAGGQSLNAMEQRYLESRFGHRLTDIRIHTGPEAETRSRHLRARAFTHGRDIYFGAGYQPSTPEGRHLLAHEVAHVVQQRNRLTPGFDERPSASRRNFLETEAERAAESVCGSQGRIGSLSNAGPQLQLQAEEVTPASQARRGETSTPSGPPVLFGIDTSTRQLYVSVTFPGRTLEEVATYLYGSPEQAVRLRDINGSLQDTLRPGTTLRFTGEMLTETARNSLDRALNNGTILRSEGIPAESTERFLVYRFAAAGHHYELTEAQFRGMLQGLALWLVRKATYIRDMAQNGKWVQKDHLDNTNSVIRGISNWLADQSVPSFLIWVQPETRANAIINSLTEMNVAGDLMRSARLISQQAQQLQEAARLLDEAEWTWHRYIEGTIAGAGSAIHTLEITRNMSFGIAAGLAGAAVAPAMFAAAGTGLASAGVTGTTATVIAGTTAVGTGAIAGGTLRGTLEVVAPGAQADTSVAERFGVGFRSGAIQGGLGAAGALVAPGISSAISSRLFGTAPQTLTTFGTRATVNVLTGVSIGAPAGMIDAAATTLPDLINGRIGTDEYLSRIGWGGFYGGLLGGVFALAHTALTRPAPPTRTLAPTETGPPTQIPPGRGGASPWEPARPQVDPATGRVSQFVRHRPTGEIFELRLDPTTGNGAITRMATGEVVHIAGGRIVPKPAGLLTAGEGQGTTSEALVTQPAEGLPRVHSLPGPVSTPHPSGTAAAGAAEGTPTAKGVLEIFAEAQTMAPSSALGAEALEATGMRITTEPQLYVYDPVSGDRIPHPGGRTEARDIGNVFNTLARWGYPMNEVPLRTRAGRLVWLDSYNPVSGEIVSRKWIQLGRVDYWRALEVVQELRVKYPSGALVADTPKARALGLANQKIRGQLILEVPPQTEPIPEGVLQYARERGIIIRDTAGRIY